MNTITKKRLIQKTAKATFAINLSVSMSSYRIFQVALNSGCSNFSFLLITINTITAIGKTIKTDKCIPCYNVNYSLVDLSMPDSYDIGMNSTIKNLINEVKNIAF